jgi:hypothetical protein
MSMIYYLVLGTSEVPAKLVATQADAKREARERGTSWEDYDVDTSKLELMAHLNQMLADTSAEVHRERYAVADLEAYPSPLAEKNPEISSPSYAQHSISIDDEWDKLPLARKLCFAASALQDARAAL